MGSRIREGKWCQKEGGKKGQRRKGTEEERDREIEEKGVRRDVKWGWGRGGGDS